MWNQLNQQIQVKDIYIYVWSYEQRKSIGREELKGKEYVYYNNKKKHPIEKERNTRTSHNKTVMIN